VAFVSRDRMFRVAQVGDRLRIYRRVEGRWVWVGTCATVAEVATRLPALGGPDIADLVED
jgi:hypothetical protein